MAVSLKLHTYNPCDPCCACIRAVAAYTDQELEIIHVPEDFLKSADFKKMNVLGTGDSGLPILETPDGYL